MAGKLKTVVISVSSREETTRRMLGAFAGKQQGSHISFRTPESMWKMLTAKRWAILKVMTGAGPLAIREIARRVERDVKAVHGDVHKLILGGIIERHESGKVVFPYDAIHVDFTLTKAA